MATFDVNLVCWRVVHDAEFYAAVKSDASTALADLELTDAERANLLAGDVKALYEDGANPFLMEHLANWFVFGLDPVLYSERIRQATLRPMQQK